MKRDIFLITVWFFLLSTQVFSQGLEQQDEAVSAHGPDTPYQGYLEEKGQIMKIIQDLETTAEKRADDSLLLGVDPSVIDGLRSTAEHDDRTQDLLADGFSVEELEVLTLLRNPNIRANEKRLQAARESLSQVWNLDEILLQYSAFTEGKMNGIGPMKGKDAIAKKFPFPGLLSLKGEVALKEVEAAGIRLEIAIRDAIASVKKSFWDFRFVLKARAITQETLELLENLEKVATARYKSGRSSYQDVIKINIQKEILKESLITLNEKELNFKVRIIELIDLPGGTAIGSPSDIVPKGELKAQEVLYTLARDNRQEIRLKKAFIGKMERMIEMSETMVFPSYSMGLSQYDDEAVTRVGSHAMKPAFSTSTSASMGAGLPRMPWYGSNDAYIRQTRQKLEALRDDLDQIKLTTNTMVRKKWFDADKARREAALYLDKIIVLSESALNVSTRGYESGNVSFSDVISSYLTWLNANMTMERKISDVAIADAELIRVVGDFEIYDN